MTTKLSDTTITNKLIAEFMEYPYRYSDTGIISGTERWEVGIGHWWCTVDELLFDSSWDWLMPVVDKIENETGWELIMYSNDCHWNKFGDFINDTEIHYVGDRKESVYKAVVEFINWYNQNKKQASYGNEQRQTRCCLYRYIFLLTWHPDFVGAENY